MEQILVDNLAMIVQKPKVIGAQCIDTDGLCLISQGSVNNQQKSGILSSIYKYASTIEEENGSPVVVIEQESSSVILCESDGILTAIHKSTT